MSGGDPVRDGILLIDKEPGWTSHDIVARLRRLTGQPRIGHTGTLDPAASGLLVACLGRATRLVEFMMGHEKRYTGRVRLGLRTTTDDAEGEVLERRPVPELDAAALRPVEEQFTGTISQLPPAYSAVKVGGRRAYSLARSGQQPKVKPRLVTIHALRLQGGEDETIEIEVECGPGTYVRSLARDIGDALGCGGHLSRLHRTRVGDYDVSDANTLADLERLSEAQMLDRAMLSTDDGIVALPALLLRDEAAGALAQGIPSRAEAVRAVDPVRIFSASGQFVGVGNVDTDGTIRCRKVLAGS